ncbi:MAG: hypothetical protein JW985_01695, partial [Alphaproteobacteria bacterium]|nr:hypothetical protein [Alphaproteobacteria bacterium]
VLIKHYYNNIKSVSFEFNSMEDVLNSIMLDRYSTTNPKPCFYNISEKQSGIKIQDNETVVSNGSLGIFSLIGGCRIKDIEIKPSLYKTITLVSDFSNSYNSIILSKDFNSITEFIPNRAFVYQMEDIMFDGGLHTGFFYPKAGSSSFIDTNSDFEYANSESIRLRNFFACNLRAVKSVR